jgi:hypothetical protein
MKEIKILKRGLKFATETKPKLLIDEINKIK